MGHRRRRSWLISAAGASALTIAALWWIVVYVPFATWRIHYAVECQVASIAAAGGEGVEWTGSFLFSPSEPMLTPGYRALAATITVAIFVLIALGVWTAAFVSIRSLIGRRVTEGTCANCGYNLYGLSGAACPECGVDGTLERRS